MDILLISHIPDSLTNDDCQSLFTHFGATSIKYYGTKGRMKNKAHIFFRNSKDAELALKRLHQLEILGSRLIAQYASSKSIKSFTNTSSLIDFSVPDQTISQVSNNKLNEESEIRRKVSREVNAISHYFNFEYPINPDLRYSYPLPTVSILTNIANALASYPKLYVQVLHLMNKMNLPAPFGSFNLPSSVPISEENEESESEIDSDSELTEKENRKRKKKQKKTVKIPKLSLISFQNIGAAVQPNQNIIDRKEIFDETIAVPIPKKIDIKVTNESEFKIPDPVVEESITDPTMSGFGKIYPNIKENINSENNDKESEWTQVDFISKEKLLENKVSDKEMKDMTIFRNYNAGEITVRLYIKNLSKKVTEQDLHYIYGSYVNWNSSDEKIMYDIRLMKEGKMKGQAFITFPNAEAATRALKQTNGYLLFDKPMVVCYARSAKLKIP